MAPLAGDLSRRGWATWNLEYRRVGARGGWPATFEDVGAGIDALADLPARERLDLRRVVAIGHSAGGHLALWAAARPGLPADAPGAGPRVAVTRAVSLAGVADLRAGAALGLGGGAVERLMGGRPDEVSGRYALASPADRLPLGVPTVLVHGEVDDVVPVDLSRRFRDAAVAAGHRCELVELAGVGHGEPIDPASPAWAEARKRL